MEKRLHLKQIASSARRGSTACTVRVALSSQQSRSPPRGDPQTTSEQAWPRRTTAAESERQTKFRRKAIAGSRNEDVRHRVVSNTMERTKPEFGETIPDGATRLFSDARESPCIV